MQNIDFQAHYTFIKFSISCFPGKIKKWGVAEDFCIVLYFWPLRMHLPSTFNVFLIIHWTKETIIWFFSLALVFFCTTSWEQVISILKTCRPAWQGYDSWKVLLTGAKSSLSNQVSVKSSHFIIPLAANMSQYCFINHRGCSYKDGAASEYVEKILGHFRLETLNLQINFIESVFDQILLTT